MSDAASTPWPTELRLHKDRKALTIAFNNGETFVLSGEYLRVKSPSAAKIWPINVVGGHRRPDDLTLDSALVGAILQCEVAS